MKNINYNDRARKLEEQSRHWAVTFARLCANAKAPVKPVLAALILVLGWVAGSLVKIPLPGGDAYPMLVTIWSYVVMFAALALSVLFALVVLTLPPPHTKSIEAGLQHIGFIDRYGFSPALVSNQGLKNSGIRELVFYSRGIDKETWARRQSAIEDVLNVHYKDVLQYGGKKRNNRNYIIIVVGQGAEIKRKDPLYDDEL